MNTNSHTALSEPTHRIALTFRTALAGLLQNTGWMLLSEGAARASRLITVIVLASVLTTVDYGIAMLALVCHELVRLLTRMGAGSRIVQCDDKECDTLAGNCYTLNWVVSVSIAVVQFSIAPVLATYYSAPQLAMLLQLMAISYLLYPLVAIKVSLLQRNNQFRHIGIVSAIAVASDNLSTALFALLGFGLTSVAIAKVLAAAVWCAGFMFANVRHVKPEWQLSTIFVLVKFALPVLLSDGLKALRGQIDVLVAGRLLAPEVFGVYSFAKSAGIGFAVSLNHAFSAAIYPRLSAYYRSNELKKGLRVVALVGLGLSGLFVTQAAMAPIYVPLLFDNAFATAGELVAILCLCAIPLLVIDIVAMSLRVQFKLLAEVICQFILVVGLLIGLYVLTPQAVDSFAWVTTAITYAVLPIVFIVYRLQQNSQRFPRYSEVSK